MARFAREFRGLASERIWVCHGTESAACIACSIFNTRQAVSCSRKPLIVLRYVSPCNLLDDALQPKGKARTKTTRQQYIQWKAPCPSPRLVLQDDDHLELQRTSASGTSLQRSKYSLPPPTQRGVTDQPQYLSQKRLCAQLKHRIIHHLLQTSNPPSHRLSRRQGWCQSGHAHKRERTTTGIRSIHRHKRTWWLD